MRKSRKMFGLISASNFFHRYESPRNVASTMEVERIFAPEATLQRWLDVEKALAEVEAELGVIPVEAAREIGRRANLHEFNLDAALENVKITKHPVVTIVWGLKSACKPQELGEYVHWGATTQDIVDTGVSLQLKEYVTWLEHALDDLRVALIKSAKNHRATIMAARTHGQLADPTTLGFKLAVWIEELSRHMERLKQAKPRVLVGNLTGAVGTFAAMGKKGLRIQELTLRRLSLGVPSICYASARDGSAEFANLLAMMATTLSKIGNEVYNLQRTEIAELEEPVTPGAVGSSTMPHKRNPFLCEGLVSDGNLARRLAGYVTDGMVIEHERDFMGLGNEIQAIPTLCCVVAHMIHAATIVIDGLAVHPKQMLQNLNVKGGIIFSEAVAFTLAKKVGRQTAHEIVYSAAMKAFEEDRPFKETILSDPEARAHLTEEEVENAMNPKNHLGLAIRVVDAVLAKYTKGQRKPTLQRL